MIFEKKSADDENKKVQRVSFRSMDQNIVWYSSECLDELAHLHSLAIYHLLFAYICIHRRNSELSSGQTLYLCQYQKAACNFLVYWFVLSSAVFKPAFQEYYQSVKQFGFRSGLSFFYLSSKFLQSLSADDASVVGKALIM